ncbi:MAG: dTDP-4-dehydrorhamnose 3,5-epimerase [Flavobacteriales bacterium]|nr:dTDP-4-dehydrorhamnose 3,5-epimerase [Flavobacteriales bacterium]
MEIQNLSLEGLKLLVPRQFKDDRGFFWETWREGMLLDEEGSPLRFVQDNLSISKAGTLRGIHFQRAPHTQGKLVRAVSGSILDVVVDLRAASPTRGQVLRVELSALNGHQLWVPAGFGHGFIAREDETTVEYRCTATYEPEYEGSIRWDDPDVAIDWQMEALREIGAPLLSEKDAMAPLLKDIDWPF